MENELSRTPQLVGEFLLSEERVALKSTLCSVSKLQYMEDPSLIDRFRRSGFEILTASNGSLVVLPKIFSDQ